MNYIFIKKKFKKILSRLIGSEYRKTKTFFNNWKFKFNLYKLKRKNTEVESSKLKVQTKKLIFNDIAKIQNIINSLSYPPTHDYQLDTLKPKGIMKMRIEQFNAISPDFFYGDKFLDIGCNKGFFSLLASKTFNKIQSIDPDLRFVNLYDQLKQENMSIEQTSFRNYCPKEEYDRILLGNVHHYLFTECNGWEWIYKLAAISTDQVIIEGPIDMTCEDMYQVVSENLRSEFTFEKFMKTMEKFFILEAKIDSILNQRYVMLFKRKHDNFNEKIELNDLQLLKPIKEDERSMIFQTEWKNKKILAKINKLPKKENRVRINISRLSPFSNNAIGSIYKKDDFVGWIEEFVDDDVYRYKENQKEILKLICEHNIFLSKLGYFDIDWATINHFKKNNKIFDKGAVWPIKEIVDEAFGNFAENKKGYFFIQLENSFDIITKKMEKLLYNALKSRNSDTIEQTLKQIIKLI